jgi:serralysin
MMVHGFSRYGLAIAVCALAAAPAHAYVLATRWSHTATNPTTGPQGSPVTLTWSLAPDQTSIPSTTPDSPSTLIGFLDSHWGAGPGGTDLTQRPWYFIFGQSMERLGAISGVTFVYEPNDDGITPPLGRPFSNAQAAAGDLGERGDVRIGGNAFPPDKPYLALTFLPPYGEVMFNTNEAPNLTNSYDNYRYFRNTMMHEAMHAAGVHHAYSSTANFLVEEVIITAFDGPQLDDILALQRHYGDALEKNGGNDAYGVATSLGALSGGQSITRGTLGNSTAVDPSAVDFVSIDDDSDIDYFSFSLTQHSTVTLDLTPQGATYMMGSSAGSQSPLNTRMLSDLSLALFDSSGTLQIGSTANANGAGGEETIVTALESGTYYARVTGAQNDVQLYQIGVSAVAAAGADFNEDGFVDGDDLTAWGGEFGRAGDATHQHGDANGDLAVDGTDFLAWQRTLQMPMMTANFTGVPEPTGWALAVGALVALAPSRRRSA